MISRIRANLVMDNILSLLAYGELCLFYFSLNLLFRKLFSKSGPRPMSAVETYRMIVSKNGQYLSPYQKLRTEEWQKGISKSISNESQSEQSDYFIIVSVEKIY